MKIGYSATFNFPNSVQPFEKHWVEDDELTHGLNLFEEITDEQLAQLTKNIRRIQYVIRSQVKDFAFESNGLAAKQAAGVVLESKPQKSAEELIIEAIESVTGMKFLKLYETHSLKSAAVKEAYDKKFAELNPVS